jgi:hypothetical protein
MNEDLDPGKAHPSVQDLAAYLDRAPEAPAGDRIEAHLVLCDRCLSDLIAAGRVLRWFDGGGR